MHEDANNIWISQGIPDDEAVYFEPSFWVHVPVANNKQLVTITGAIKLAYTGANGWAGKTLHVGLNFPPICPDGQWFEIEHWAPFFSLNGIRKGGDNHYGGWNVRYFGMDLPPLMKVRPAITIWAYIETEGAEFEIMRIGYSLTVSGHFAEPPPGPQ